MKKTRKLTLLVILALVVRVEIVFPQASVSTAELRGQITDQSGAAVAGATITITDVGKGTTRTVTSDENGNYVFLSLPPSVYTLKIEASGFAPKTLTNLKLDVGQAANIPVQLSVSGVTAEVNIAAGTEVIEIERTQQSSVISERFINNLPINRRNYLDFALLTPGVTDSDSINDSSDFRVAQTPQSGLSFGGNNGRGNSILVDGASADTNSGGARDVVSQEAVQEFQVNRNSYNAEFGGSSGGIVNIVSKTGSNEFHGSAFGYFRDDTFDAHNAFDFNPAGQSPFNRQQYGGSLGGPIRHDKTFIFGSFERLDEDRTTFVNLLNDPNIFNVTSGQNTLFNFLASTPFAALATSLRGALTTTEANYPRTVNLFRSASGQFPFMQNATLFTARLDHTFSSKDSGYIRFNMGDAFAENQAAGALTAVSRGRTIESFNAGLLLSETHFFSPVTINEVKAQYSYLDNDVISNDLVGPEFNIEGFGNFGRDIFLPSEAIERRYEISDNLAMVRGNHTFKVGGQYQAIDTSANSQTFFGGRFNFGNVLPLINLVPAALRTPLNTLLRTSGGALGADGNGNGIADSLDAPITALQSFNLNLPIVYQQGFGDSGFNPWSHRVSFYGQDSWKVRQNFTFNFGVRYFLQNDVDPIPLDKNNVQPRVGFSWDPFSNGKTVIRGGYGLFTGQIDGQITNVVNELNGNGTPSNINIVLATATSGALGLPTSFTVYQTLLAQGVIGSRVITAQDLAQFGVTPGPGKPLEVRFRVGDDYENPYTQQASLAIQQDLGADFIIEVSYLFSRGTHLTRNRDVNPFKMTGPVNPFSGTGSFIRFPTAAQAAAGLTSDFRNPFILQDNRYESTASSFYHAGTFQLTKRFTHHFALNANYTFSKSIDEVTDFNSDFSAQNPLDFRADRALSAFDQRHRLVVSGVFESPLKGDSVIDHIFGRWVFAPIAVIGSGRPFNLLLGFDANGDGRSQSDRPAKAGRNTGRGEDFYVVDIRLARKFNLSENRYFEFTFEAFNLFNRTNYNGINNIVGTLYGTTDPPLFPLDARGNRTLAPTRPLGFTSAAAARQLQFGVRFNF
jgi:hypothetical protein